MIHFIKTHSHRTALAGHGCEKPTESVPERLLLPGKASKSGAVNCQEEDMLLLKTGDERSLMCNPFHLMSCFYGSLALILIPK